MKSVVLNTNSNFGVVREKLRKVIQSCWIIFSFSTDRAIIAQNIGSGSSIKSLRKKVYEQLKRKSFNFTFDISIIEVNMLNNEIRGEKEVL